MMKKYEVWSEEIVFNGSSVPVKLHGIVEAETFREACIELSRVNPEYERYYNVHSNTWFGARLFPSKEQAEQGEMNLKKSKVMPYDDILDEIEDNPQILISALTRLIYKDEDELPEDIFNLENEVLKRKLNVAEQHIQTLKQHLKDKDEHLAKLKQLLKEYSEDCIDEVDVYAKARIHNLESSNRYLTKENERLEQAIKTLS